MNENSNPDVITLLANLSSDEVFTPPKIVNQMLDQLPSHIWKNKDLKFLDPFSKSGIFLREITERLLDGLEEDIPNFEHRLEHILHNQVFGIGITELTSLIARRTLYHTKNANGKYSVVKFDNEQGNIKYIEKEHDWSKSSNCRYCGINQENYTNDPEFESHAYSFIHEEEPANIFDMKFDVIIGNPPYQLDTGQEKTKQAKPIYHLFIENAIKLNPTYLSMIIPSRWFAGGFGLKNFRDKMLNDKRMKVLVDFENYKEVFSGPELAGGVCYFLWDKNYDGDCTVINSKEDEKIENVRKLNEFPIFIRRNESLPILRKVNKWVDTNNSEFLSNIVSPIKPFGLPSNYTPKIKGVPCYFKRSIGKMYAHPDDVTIRHELIDKWKVLIPKAPIAGQTDLTKPIKFYHPDNAFIAEPGSVCTESWIIASYFNSENEAKNFQSYLFTKIVRFLILQTVVAQDVNSKNYIFVPNMKNYKKEFDDNELRKLFKITKDEWEYIDSRILPSKE